MSINNIKQTLELLTEQLEQHETMSQQVKVKPNTVRIAKSIALKSLAQEIDEFNDFDNLTNLSEGLNNIVRSLAGNRDLFLYLVFCATANFNQDELFSVFSEAEAMLADAGNQEELDSYFVDDCMCPSCREAYEQQEVAA